ncbi:hypothetical protein Tco_0409516 [Tanacetum coccineum]
MDKGCKQRSPPHNLRQKPGQYICCQNHKLIADIENDIMDPVMQCTTLLSHSGFSQQKLVSFVTEITPTLSIDIVTPSLLIMNSVNGILHKPLPSQGIHTDSSLDHMDEGFIATAYPNVQENLKLPVEEQVILEEQNEKTTAETEAESMVSVTIHQDTSAIPPMTSPVIDLISRPDYPNEHQPLPATTTATAIITTTITTLPLPPQP